MDLDASSARLSSEAQQPFSCGEFSLSGGVQQPACCGVVSPVAGPAWSLAHQPLSPRQPPSLLPLATPTKPPLGGLRPPPSDKENSSSCASGSTASTASDGSCFSFSAHPSAAAAAAAVSSASLSPAALAGGRPCAAVDCASPRGAPPLADGRPCAAVDRALLLLQSSATDRAAAVRDIIAADIMLLIR